MFPAADSFVGSELTKALAYARVQRRVSRGFVNIIPRVEREQCTGRVHHVTKSW